MIIASTRFCGPWTNLLASFLLALFAFPVNCYSANPNTIFKQDPDAILILSPYYGKPDSGIVYFIDGPSFSEFDKLKNTFNVRYRSNFRYIGPTDGPSIDRILNNYDMGFVLVQGKKQYDELFGEEDQDWPFIGIAHSTVAHVPGEILPSLASLREFDSAEPWISVDEFNKILVAANTKADPACASGQSDDEPRPPETAEDINRIKAAAEAGDADAQWLFGVLYDEGKLGLPEKQSQNEAIEWFAKSAKQCNRYAQNSLARIYYKQGDMTKAQSYFLKSAAQGNGLAMFNLGIASYTAGAGKAIALGWLDMARQNGSRFVVNAAMEDMRTIKTPPQNAGGNSAPCQGVWGFSCNSGLDTYMAMKWSSGKW